MIQSVKNTLTMSYYPEFRRKEDDCVFKNLRKSLYYPRQKQYCRHYPCADCSDNCTYYKGKLVFVGTLPCFFKTYAVQIQLCLVSELTAARHFGTDIENCLFKIFVFSVVYLKHQFVHRFYQFYKLLFSTFQDYKVYYRKYM